VPAPVLAPDFAVGAVACAHGEHLEQAMTPADGLICGEKPRHGSSAGVELRAGRRR